MKKQLLFAGLLLAGQAVLAQEYPQQATISKAIAGGIVSQHKAVETLVATNRIDKGASVLYQAGQSITLQPGFTAQAGAVFEAMVAPVNSQRPGSDVPGLSVRAYPNPFQDKTTLDYNLPIDGKVNHELRDMKGQLLREMLGDDVESAGRHQTQFDGTNLPTGTYLYRIQVGKQSQIIRLLKKD